MRVVLMLLACVVFAILIAQQPANPLAQPGKLKLQSKQQDERPGRMEGRVVDRAGQPLPNVTVALTANVVGGGRALGNVAILLGRGAAPPTAPDTVAQTGADGSFRFENLAPGAYHIDFSSPGFIAVTVGTIPGVGYASSEEFPDPLNVPPGETENLNVVLTRQAVIAGQVIDEGEGLQGVQVRAARYVYVGGQRELRSFAAAVTNDLGEFRLPNLEPGRYYLYTESQPAGSGFSFQNLREALRPQGLTTESTTLLPTYYPNSLGLAGATAIEVAEGREFRADIRIRRERVHHVRGIVLGVSGNPARGMVAALAPNVPPPAFSTTAVGGQQIPFLAAVITNEQGQFDLRLPSGPHTFAVYGGTRTMVRMGQSGSVIAVGLEETPDENTMGLFPLSVGDADMRDVRFSLAPSGTIHGSVIVEGGSIADLPGTRTPADAGAENAKVGAGMARMKAKMMTRQTGLPIPDLLPADRPVTLGPSINLSDPERGKYTIEGVPAGRYKMDWSIVPAGYYIKSIRFGGIDTTRSELNFPGGTGELVVTLAKGLGTISGSVTSGNNEAVKQATVVLWPKTPDNSTSSGGARALDTTGTGALQPLQFAPGEYYAAAFAPMNRGVLQYRPLLDRFAARAVSVKLEPNGSATVNLSIIAEGEIQAEIAKLP
jgi:hypothetical protein